MHYYYASVVRSTGGRVNVCRDPVVSEITEGDYWYESVKNDRRYHNRLFSLSGNIDGSISYSGFFDDRDAAWVALASLAPERISERFMASVNHRRFLTGLGYP